MHKTYTNKMKWQDIIDIARENDVLEAIDEPKITDVIEILKCLAFNPTEVFFELDGCGWVVYWTDVK